MNEDKEASDNLDAAIEAGLVCTDCGCNIDEPRPKRPSKCEDCNETTD